MPRKKLKRRLWQSIDRHGSAVPLSQSQDIRIDGDARTATEREKIEALKAIYVYYFARDPGSGEAFDLRLIAALDGLKED